MRLICKMKYICSVKDLIRNVTFLLAIGLYLSSFSIIHGSSLPPNSSSTNAVDSTSLNYYQKALSDPLNALPSFENLALAFEDTDSDTDSVLFYRFSANVVSSEWFYCNSYRQYIINSRNLLTRFRKQDLIFPSHYFW